MLSPLSQLDDWELEYEWHDIRGWPVEDAAGRTVGVVVDLIANTDAQQIESVMVDTGERFPVSDVLIGDGIAYLKGIAVGAAEPSRPGERAFGIAPLRRRVV